MYRSSVKPGLLALSALVSSLAFLTSVLEPSSAASASKHASFLLLLALPPPAGPKMLLDELLDPLGGLEETSTAGGGGLPADDDEARSNSDMSHSCKRKGILVRHSSQWFEI